MWLRRASLPKWQQGLQQEQQQPDESNVILVSKATTLPIGNGKQISEMKSLPNNMYYVRMMCTVAVRCVVCGCELVCGADGRSCTASRPRPL